MSLEASTDLPFVGAGLLPLSLEGLRPAVAAWQRMTAITALSLRRLGIDNVSDDLAFTGGGTLEGRALRPDLPWCLRGDLHCRENLPMDGPRDIVLKRLMATLPSLPSPPLRIALVGMSGSGKTFWAKRLAAS